MISLLEDIPIIQTSPGYHSVDESITEWLRKQGYEGQFDTRYNVLILPQHMKVLFRYEAPYLRFSKFVPVDQMFVADMRYM